MCKMMMGFVVRFSICEISIACIAWTDLYIRDSLFVFLMAW